MSKSNDDASNKSSKLSPVDERSEKEDAEIVSERSERSETPRITNSTEGTKKQKVATKKLSTYSEDARKRMTKKKSDEDQDTEDDHNTGQTSQQPEENVERLPPPQRSYSINTLTILGALLAIGGLYFAYRADQRESAADITEDVVQEEAPKKKSTSKIRTL